MPRLWACCDRQVDLHPPFGPTSNRAPDTHSSPFARPRCGRNRTITETRDRETCSNRPHRPTSPASSAAWQVPPARDKRFRFPVLLSCRDPAAPASPQTGNYDSRALSPASHRRPRKWSTDQSFSASKAATCTMSYPPPDLVGRCRSESRTS